MPDDLSVPMLRPPTPNGARSVGAGAYEVLVGRGMLEHAAPFIRFWVRGARRLLLVHDDRLPRSLIDTALAAMKAGGIETGVCAVTADEEHKCFATLERICAAAVGFRLEREEPIVAMGGGVVGDVAGFAAAVYRRGVPLVQFPTTLLSMVDASVGGKTAVNIRAIDRGKPGTLKKNMAGAFHMPSLVLCDVDALASLPDREMRSGLAECIKHGLIGADFGDPTLADYTQKHGGEFLSRETAQLTVFVARNVAVKANCVQRDPHERGSKEPHGGRMALNCGHTVAHAIETLPGLTHGTGNLGGLTHGEAVGLGLLAECHLAVKMGLNEPAAAERLCAMLTGVGLPTNVRGLPGAEAILAAMLDDKKVAAGRLRMALPCEGNRCRLVTNPPRDALRAAIETIRAE